MSMNYNGITFDTVSELITYKEWELGKHTNHEDKLFEAQPEQITSEPRTVIVRNTKYANSNEVLATCSKLERKHKEINLQTVLDELGIRKTKKAKKAVYKTILRLVNMKELYRLEQTGTFCLQPQKFDDRIIPHQNLREKAKGSRAKVVEALENIGRPAKLGEIISELGMPQGENSSQKIDALLRRLVEKKVVVKTGQKLFYSYSLRGKQPAQYSERKEKYLSFLSHAMKKYMNEPYRYSIEKARAIAAQEWETFKDQKTVRVPITLFPSLIGIADKDLDIFVTMVKNVIVFHGKLRWEADGKMLNITSYVQWKDFVAEFMQHSLEIADYFTVPNRFVTELIDNRIQIVYR